MKDEPVQSQDGVFPIIRRGSVASLSLYEVTDYELDLLEQGSPSGLFLNFGIFLLSVGLSFALAVTTANIENDRLFTVYSIISIVGIVLGILLTLLWFRSRKSTKHVCKKIRSRIIQEIDASSSSVPSIDPTSNS
ncbi:hypothetical protein N6L26_12105 [Qipengyuania sp. SS22]|uniref:hypothetical protein n=1 Tax=Qipengyuania sp. SS22 TaxID=2979461 RepID=UPI0021E5CADF|nr:hypothetical protein [Qipengyuania sp. SS22]UYH54771.1 hypothetical protein N6L26_12105 [Qipengyuania sp. SS22]